MYPKKGFTMTELSVVVVIIIVLAGTLVPRYLSGVNRAKIDTATRQVVNAMRFARQAAITTKDNVRVAAILNTTKVCVVNDATSDTLWRFPLPSGTQVMGITGVPTFHPRGTSIGGTIRVTNASGCQKDIIVNVVSRVRVEDVNEGDG